MKKQLNCILIIDDDKPINFLNRMILKKSGCVKNIQITSSGFEALDYLRNTESKEYIKPDLIMLDINMPAMNGWEFLNEYKNLPSYTPDQIIVVMVTTSLNPKDKEKAKNNPEIKDFINKPLTVEILINLLKRNVPTLFED